MSQFIEFLKSIQPLTSNNSIKNSLVDKHKFYFNYSLESPKVVNSFLALFKSYIDNENNESKIKEIKELFSQKIQLIYDKAKNKVTLNDLMIFDPVDKLLEICNEIYANELGSPKNEFYVWALKKIISLDLDMIADLESKNPTTFETIRPKNRIIENSLNLLKHALFNTNKRELDCSIILNSIESARESIKNYNYHSHLYQSTNLIQGLTHLINSDFEQSTKIFKDILGAQHSIDDVKATVGYSCSTENIILVLLKKVEEQYSCINIPSLSKYQARLKMQSLNLLADIFDLDSLKRSKAEERMLEISKRKEIQDTSLSQLLDSIKAQGPKITVETQALMNLLSTEITKNSKSSNINHKKSLTKKEPYKHNKNKNAYPPTPEYEGDTIFIIKYMPYRKTSLDLMKLARINYIKSLLGFFIDPNYREKFKLDVFFEEDFFKLSFEIPSSHTLFRIFKGLPGSEYSFKNGRHNIKFSFQEKIKESNLNDMLIRINTCLNQADEYVIKSLAVEFQKISISSEQNNNDNELIPYIDSKSSIVSNTNAADEAFPKQKIKTRKLIPSSNNNNNNNDTTQTPEAMIVEELHDQFGENVTIGRIRNTSSRVYKYVILPSINAIDLDLTNEQYQSIERIFEQPSIVGFSNMQGFKYYNNCNHGLVAKMKGANGHIRLTPGQIVEKQKNEKTPAYSAYYYNKGFTK